MRPPQRVLRLVLGQLQRLAPGGRGGSVQPGAGLVLGALRLVGLFLGELRVMGRVGRQHQRPGVLHREVDEVVHAETGREMIRRVGLLLGHRGQHHPQRRHDPGQLLGQFHRPPEPGQVTVDGQHQLRAAQLLDHLVVETAGAVAVGGGDTGRAEPLVDGLVVLLALAEPHRQALFDGLQHPREVTHHPPGGRRVDPLPGVRIQVPLFECLAADPVLVAFVPDGLHEQLLLLIDPVVTADLDPFGGHRLRAGQEPFGQRPEPVPRRGSARPPRG